MAVNVDWEVIEGVEDLDKVFKKALARAEEADEPEIRQQWSESKAQFWERRAQAQALQVAKRDALDKFPLAKDFADDIRGNTPQEIEAQAKRFHERMEKLTADAAAAKQKAEEAETQAKQQAQQQYGQPASAGGGTPARPSLEDNDALKERVLTRLQKGQGLQDSQGKMDSIRYQNLRFAEGVEASIRNPSYRSFSRNSPDDKKVQDDRTRRKGT